MDVFLVQYDSGNKRKHEEAWARLFDNDTDKTWVLSQKELIKQICSGELRVKNLAVSSNYMYLTMGHLYNFNYVDYSNGDLAHTIIGMDGDLYKVVNTYGDVIMMTPEQLYSTVFWGGFINAKVDKINGEIKVEGIDCNIYQLRKGEYIHSKNYEEEFKSFGGYVKEFETDCGHKCYLAEYHADLLLYIPDDVVTLNSHYEDESMAYGCFSQLAFGGLDYGIDSPGRTLRVIGGGKNLKDISFLISDASDILSVDLSNLDTQNVVNMEGLFEFNPELREVNLENINTQNVENMDSMFSMCDRLKKIDASSFNTPNLKTAVECFDSCKNLEELDISNFNTNKIEHDIKEIIANCKKLNKVKVKDANIQKLLNEYGIEYIV